MKPRARSQKNKEKRENIRESIFGFPVGVRAAVIVAFTLLTLLVLGRLARRIFDIRCNAFTAIAEGFDFSSKPGHCNGFGGYGVRGADALQLQQRAAKANASVENFLQ